MNDLEAVALRLTHLCLSAVFMQRSPELAQFYAKEAYRAAKLWHWKSYYALTKQEEDEPTHSE